MICFKEFSTVTKIQRTFKNERFENKAQVHFKMPFSVKISFMTKKQTLFKQKISLLPPKKALSQPFKPLNPTQ